MVHVSLTWRSIALDMDTKVDVLLPEDRHHRVDISNQKHPVLYILHGSKEDNSSWVNLSNIFLMCRDLDLIVVMPSVGLSVYNDMVYGQKYYTYISDELPEKMANYFPISKEPKDNFIMGESMGGYGTLRMVLSKPENYGKAVCLSGGNFIEFLNKEFTPLQVGVFGSKEEYLHSDANLDNLIVKYEKCSNEPEIIFYCGTDDHVYPVCKSFYDTMEKKFPDKIKGEFWPGEHNFFFWNQAIPKALKEFGFEVVTNSQSV